MMHDLTKIRKSFDELVFSRLSDEVLKRNNIAKVDELIREDLINRKEMIELPFGFITYFLVLENEKPVLYLEKVSRMGIDELYVIDESSCDKYDIYEGVPPEIKDRYLKSSQRIAKEGYVKKRS